MSKTTFFGKIITGIRRRFIAACMAEKRATKSVIVIRKIIGTVAILAALALIASIVVAVGFEHSEHDMRMLRRTLRYTELAMAANIITGWLTAAVSTGRPKGWIAISIRTIIELTVVIAAFSAIFHGTHPWPSWWGITSCVAALFYGIAIISETIIASVSRRTNPALIMSGSFIILIIVGTLLLMLPKCNNTPIGACDALFVSTSAVCITGLTSVDISAQFTPLGICILSLLIQAGALGLMTFTVVFAMFFSGSPSIYSQIMLKDMVYSRSLSTILPTVIKIILFTLIIEAAGAFATWLSIRHTMGMKPTEEITFAFFHSLSAFCNAGFSTLPDGMANPRLLYGNISIYWITTIVTVIGALGFPVLINAGQALQAKLTSRRNKRHVIHTISLNTRTVIIFYFILLLFGAIIFWLMETDNALKGMTVEEQITQSFFASGAARSSGFTSLPQASLLSPTLLCLMLLMWVGGASQSTAGGIKVNTLAAICYNLKAIVKGAPKVTAFNRTIATGSIRRANAVVTVSIFSYFLISGILLIIEPELSAKSLLYESLSALFTVGSSLGITSELSDPSLVLLSIAMFAGRLGILSLASGLVRQSPGAIIAYPSDNIIIS